MHINELKGLTKSQYLSIRKTLRSKRLWTRDFGRTTSVLEDRQALRNKIAKMSEGGKIAVYEWGRDCDMCESDSVSLIPASVMAYERFENNVYDGAEGPTNVHIMWMKDALEFEPSFRDRIAEAWDNGNTLAHVV